MSRRIRDAGFTLFEVVVALAVLGLLLLGLAEGLRLGLQVWERQRHDSNVSGDLEAVDRVIRGLIVQIDPGIGERSSGFAGDGRRVTFFTEYADLPTAPAAPDLRRFQVALGVDRMHRLVLRWVFYPRAQRLGPAGVPSESALLEGIDHIELAYGRPARENIEWVASWSSKTPPALVRVRIVYLPGDRRSWPDIVASPVRARL